MKRLEVIFSLKIIFISNNGVVIKSPLFILILGALDLED